VVDICIVEMCGYKKVKGRRRMSNKCKRIKYRCDLTQCEVCRIKERSMICILICGADEREDIDVCGKVGVGAGKGRESLKALIYVRDSIMEFEFFA